jgi:hypothetical protein
MQHSPLAPCPGCSRHVRVDEPACPFCATALSERPPTPAAPTELFVGRVAVVVLAASLAVGAGCSSVAEAQPRHPPQSVPVPAYGVPPPRLPEPVPTLAPDADAGHSADASAPHHDGGTSAHHDGGRPHARRDGGSDAGRRQ